MRTSRRLSVDPFIAIVPFIAFVLLSCQSWAAGNQRVDVRPGNFADFGLVLHQPTAVITEGRLVVTGAVKKLNPSIPPNTGHLVVTIFDSTGTVLAQSNAHHHPVVISPRINQKSGAKFSVAFESTMTNPAPEWVQISFHKDPIAIH